MFQQGQQIADISLFERRRINLGFTSGSIHPYKDFPLNEIITTPVIFDVNGQLSAYITGYRSALVRHYLGWFKYKGIHPRPNMGHESGEPYGSMSKKKAIRELEVFEAINRGFEKYGYRGPLIPAGYMEYDIPYNGENVCCSISKTHGDTRVLEIWNYLYHNPVTENPRLFHQFLKKLNEWLGFAYRILREQSVLPSPESIFLDNYAFFRTNGGYGISRIDMGSAEFKNDEARLRDYADDIRGWANSFSFPFNPFSYAARLKMSPKEILIKNKKIDIEIEEVKRVSDERIEVDRRGTEVLYVAKRRFKISDRLEKSFSKAFDGEVVPEPFDERIINSIFSKRKAVRWSNRTFW